MARARVAFLIAASAAVTAGACSSFDGASGNAPASDAGVDALGPGAPTPGTPGTPGADGGADAEAPKCSPSVDFTSDPKNCGACGHDCLGGACESGKCKPFRAVYPPANVAELAITTSGVQWYSDGSSTIFRCPTEGCPDGGAVGLAAFPFKATTMTPFGEDLLVGTEGPANIVTTPKGKATPISGFAEIADAIPVGSDSFAFVFKTGGATAIYFGTSTAGGRVESPTLSIAALAAIDRKLFIYSYSPEALTTCDLADPTSCLEPTSLFGAGYSAGGDRNVELAAARDGLFWIEGGQIRTCAPTGCQAPSTLFSEPGLDSIAADETYVYFTNAIEGTVERCPHDGCGDDRVTLAAGMNVPHAIRVTPNAIYWATDANASLEAAIWRIAR